MVKNLNRLIGNGSSQQSAPATNATNAAQGQLLVRILIRKEAGAIVRVI